MTMKVLFLSNEYGIQRSTSAYTHRLEKLRGFIQSLGIQADFLSLREQPVGKPILAQPLNLPVIRQKIAHYDFIHAGGDAAYVAAMLKPFTRARIIRDVHGDTLSEANLKWQTGRNPHTAHMLMQAWITNAVAYRYSDYFMVVCKPLRQRLIDERSIPAERIAIIRNGVDLGLFDDQADGELSRQFTVAYAGGFQAWQGVENLLKAMELLQSDSIYLRMIGFTERQAELKSRILEQLGAKAELINRVSRDELVTYLSSAHILVIPRSRHRAVEAALPTKFAEYLALGKPVIVCDVDETAQLVREHGCGLVCNPNPKSLAETIRLASNLSSVELKRMGQNARCLAEQEFSWEKIGSQYMSMLQEWDACGG